MENFLRSRWVESFAAAMLGLATLFAYLKGNPDTAIVTGICFGFLSGMLATMWMVRQTHL